MKRGVRRTHQAMVRIAAPFCGEVFLAAVFRNKMAALAIIIRELRDFVSALAGPVRYDGGSMEESPGALSHGAGLRWRNVVESPLLGPAGNKEFLVLVEKECAD